MNELSMVLPGEGWVDRSSHHLSIQAPDGSRVNLDITRELPASPAEFLERVDDELRSLSRRVRGFDLLGRQEFQTPAVQGIAASYRSVTPDGALHHEVVYLPLPTSLMVFTVTGFVRHATACSELIGQAIGGARVR